MKLQFENDRKCILTIENSDEIFSLFEKPDANVIVNTINSVLMHMYEQGEPNVVNFMESILAGKDGIQSDAYGNQNEVTIIINKMTPNEMCEMAEEQGDEDLAQRIDEFYSDVEDESYEQVTEIFRDCIYHFDTLDQLIDISKMLTANFDIYKTDKDYCVLVTQDSTDEQWNDEHILVEYSDSTEFYESSSFIANHFLEHGDVITNTNTLKQICEKSSR